jgi:hypothetical protein
MVLPQHFDGLQNALRRLHVDKEVADLAQEFKVVDLNGDGEIDFDEPRSFSLPSRSGTGSALRRTSTYFLDVSQNHLKRADGGNRQDVC